MTGKIQTYAEFWPFYLSEHAHPRNRTLHLIGTGLALLLQIAAVVMLNIWLLLASLVVGYGFAWLGHFRVEHNRPATFTYPLWSLYSDYRMFFLFVTGRLNAELRRHHIA
jgi:hypothetical protein